jgi:hypothetical protein
MKQKAVLNSRMGYQKKNYTSEEIDVAWIKDWNKQTKEKTAG